MNTKQSLGETTLNELLKGAARYRPFVAAVAAVVLVVAFLPGKQTPKVSTTASSGKLVSPNGGAASGTETTDTTPAATDTGAAAGGTGGAAAAGGTKLAAGTKAVTTAGGTTAGPKAGTVTNPTATTDQWCDPATGRQKIPSLFAPPCVPPFDGQNGGSTYQGVTDKQITIAIPHGQPNAAGQAILAAAGDTDTSDQIIQTQKDYIDYFEHHYQTYGRKINAEFFESQVNPSDSDAAKSSEAQSDANHVAKETKAFASIGDDGQASYEDTLVANHVLCICTVTLPSKYYLDRAPYIWGTGLPDETQDYDMRAEMICKEIAGNPPEFAGEDDLKPPVLNNRVYALMWPQEPSNAYKPGAEFFQQKLKDECNVTFKDVVGFQLSDITNPSQAQSEAQTFMAKFKTDGVSSVVFVGDPITPVYFTSAATQQQYYPEWIQTGSALTDTALFARLYDQKQWVHNFGFSALGDRVPSNLTDSYFTYNWQFNKTPPASSSYGPVYASMFEFFNGVMLAGPKLTPETFRCGQPPYTINAKGGFQCVGQTYPGLFGYPISPTKWQDRVANPVIAWGDKLWDWDDYNQSDDGTLIWWDPNASGPAENNVQGNGLYRYINNGKRYMFGSFPSGKQPWFKPENTVTIFSELPGPDKPPQYKYACYYLCNSPGY